MFYARFLALCKEKGVSTSKAAIDAGFSKSTVTKWKRDPAAKPSVSVVAKLCKYFDVSVSELLGTEEEDPDRPRPTREDIKFALFGGSGSSENMPATQLPEARFTDGKIGAIELLVACGLCASNGEARRLIQQGGVAVDDQKVASIDVTFDQAQFAGDGVVIKKGKKVFHRAYTA